MKSAPTPHAQLRVGRLTKAHGLKGALKIEMYSDDPARRFVPGAVFSLQVPATSAWHGKTIELIELRWYNTHPVGFFTNVCDRSTAQSLVKAILWVDLDTSARPNEDDAWYNYQLVGLSAMRDGQKVGVVTRIDHRPAQDLLVVATPTGDVQVPFVREIVPTVDIAAGIVAVTPPEGLFDAATNGRSGATTTDEVATRAD